MNITPNLDGSLSAEQEQEIAGLTASTPMAGELRDAQARGFTGGMMALGPQDRRAIMLMDWSNMVHSLNRSALDMTVLLLRDEQIKVPLWRRWLAKRWPARAALWKHDREQLVETAAGAFARLVADCHNPDYAVATQAQEAIERLLVDDKSQPELRRFVMTYALCFMRCSFLVRIILKHVPKSLDDAPTESLHAFELFMQAFSGLPSGLRGKALDHWRKLGALPDSLDTSDLRRAALGVDRVFGAWLKTDPEQAAAPRTTEDTHHG